MDEGMAVVKTEKEKYVETAEKIEVRKKRGYLFTKRAFDIIASGIALVVLLPVILILALLIFIDDPHGSPFFVQVRIGKDEKPFKFYKLRSMVVNAETMVNDLLDQNEMDGPVFKIKEDPRITRVGRFIRKTSIDELPQLFNVLKGDMSIVGPRPPLPREVAEYGEYEKQRLMVKPGLTCIWQTQLCRNEIPFEQWVAMDIEYIEKRGFLLDLKLIFRTFRAVITCSGE